MASESGGMSRMHVRRLQAELQELSDNPPPGIEIIDGNSLKEWKLKMTGAEGSIYGGEIFYLRFRFSEGYPMESPEVIFVDSVPYHEHVYSNGHICLSILYDGWSPALTVAAVCLSIQSMLSTAQEKRRPVDNESYVAHVRSSPKNMQWGFHGLKWWLHSINFLRRHLLEEFVRLSPNKSLLFSFVVLGQMPPLLGRANRGLYAGKGISFGNSISAMGNKNRRAWRPNVQRCSLYSETLETRLRLRVTTTALKAIDAVGGLDQYILRMRVPLESDKARELKRTLLMTMWKNEIQTMKNRPETVCPAQEA